MGAKRIDINANAIFKPVQMGGTDDFTQITEPFFGLDEEDKLVPCPRRQLRTHNGLDTVITGLQRKFHRAEQIIGVGHGHSRHFLALAELDCGPDLDRPFRQRVRRMGVQMDKLWAHGFNLKPFMMDYQLEIQDFPSF